MKKATKEKILREKPFCCYCGGGTPSKTIDHNPAKVFFLKRNSPVGYDEFPACLKCNEGVKREESLFGLIAKFSKITSDDPDEFQRFKRMLYSLRDREQEFLLELFKTSARDKRNYAKENNIKLMPGQFYHDEKFPIVNIRGPHFAKVATVIGQKLFLGLYYKHTGNIVPLNGRVVFRWDNIRTLFNNAPDTFIESLDHKPEISRAGQNMKKLFDYHYGFAEKSIRILASFRNIIFFTGFVFEEPLEEELKISSELKGYRVLPPLNYKSHTAKR